MRHLFLILLLFSFIGCTSNKKEGDGASDLDSSEAMADDSSLEDFDDEALDEEFPDDPLDEDFEDLSMDEVADADDMSLDEEGLEGEDYDVSADEATDSGDDFFDEDGSGDGATAEALSDESFDEEYEAVDGGDDLSYTEPGYNDVEEGTRTFIPVKKIKSEPYDKASRLVNAVYIVRDGDSLSSISSKIYGTPDRESELLEINPNLANKISVGDKVYYNSPNRPDDRGRLLSYYEDSNLPPNVYSAKRGENIRDIAENILGNRNSWKELWAKNIDLEESEKWTLAQDREIAYWPAGAVAAAPPASDMPVGPEGGAPTDMPPPPPSNMMGDMPPPPSNMMGDMPPPASDMMGDIPPPPPPPSDMMGDMPPPPPPPSDMMGDMPPPPPPPALADTDDNQGTTASGGVMDKLPGGGDKVTILAAGVVLITLVLLVAIRKRAKARQRDIENTAGLGGETQI